MTVWGGKGWVAAAMVLGMSAAGLAAEPQGRTAGKMPAAGKNPPPATLQDSAAHPQADGLAGHIQGLLAAAMGPGSAVAVTDPAGKTRLDLTVGPDLTKRVVLTDAKSKAPLGAWTLAAAAGAEEREAAAQAILARFGGMQAGPTGNKSGPATDKAGPAR